jgi:hypothetical protein
MEKKLNEFAKILGMCNDYININNQEESILPHEA